MMVSQKSPSNTFKPESFWSKKYERVIFILKKGLLLNSRQRAMGSFVTAIFQLFLLGIRHKCRHVFDCNLEALGSIQACRRDETSAYKGHIPKGDKGQGNVYNRTRVNIDCGKVRRLNSRE